MDVELAKVFVISEVLDPAINAPSLSKKAHAAVKRSKQWIPKFQRVGDLWTYLERFQTPSSSEVYRELTQAGLKTFESLWPEFDRRFGRWKEDQTRLADFVVGKSYSSFDLAIFTKTYDNRSGGILVIGQVPNHEAVFLKVNLSGESYPNAWLEPGQRLKAYLKSRTNPHTGVVVFDPAHVENRAVLEFPNVPVYVFTRETTEGAYLLEGIFRNEALHVEEDQSKWFELVKWDQVPLQVLEDRAHYEAELGEKVRAASQDSQTERAKRLALASSIPKEIRIVSKGYLRSPDVIAEVLFRAKGYCEICKKQAPFLREKDGSPYLEVHHKIQLSDGGEDSVQNAVAACPNCHRKAHFA
ncbi:HNH endonuclease [Geothrix terrae]|uniref:HNH endonuclease n=1 Tax=Geothrix terrae TaxID=2922720 RepID=UPI001FAB5845|nr:HNH endonuclease signature motif containing protein [Geothrix terrae]